MRKTSFEVHTANACLV